jgi:DNA primase
MIPTTYIDALVEAADIVEVIGSDIELKKGGHGR